MAAAGWLLPAAPRRQPLAAAGGAEAGGFEREAPAAM